MNKDERKALAFLGLLLVLAGAARVADRQAPADLSLLVVVDMDSLEDVSRALLEREERRRRGMAVGERLDPNTAPAEELDRLPGVGPALAARVAADREARGPFRTLGDLRRVPGVGATTLERIAPYLTLPPGPPAGSSERVGELRRAGDPAGASSSSRGVRGTTGATGAGGTVSINHATAGELTALPGIGPALAARVVAYRDTAGPFRAVDELIRVPGIGPARLAALRPLVRLEP